MANGNLLTTTVTIPVNVTVTSGSGVNVVPITLLIEVKEGHIVSIKGHSETKEYEGTLNLKSVSSAEGGDECIRCDPSCHVVDCPA